MYNQNTQWIRLFGNTYVYKEIPTLPSFIEANAAKVNGSKDHSSSFIQGGMQPISSRESCLWKVCKVHQRGSRWPKSDHTGKCFGICNWSQYWDLLGNQ